MGKAAKAAKNQIKLSFRGKHADRYRREPVEEHFALQWQKINMLHGGPAEARTLLADLLGDGCRQPAFPSNRDRLVANTVIQWLGSPTGQFGYKRP